MKHLKKINEMEELTPEIESQDEFSKKEEVLQTGVRKEVSDVHWYAEMGGVGDYKLTFKNLEGKEASAIFKDTGNRETNGSEMRAAFISLPGKSSDGKNYIADAQMKKVAEGEFRIERFLVYEH